MQTQRRDPRPAKGAENASDRDRDGDGASGLEGDPVVDELRRLYKGIADEPLPDQLLDLLRKLDEVERQR